VAQKGMKELDSKAWRAFHAINQRLLPHLGTQITQHSGLTGPEYIVLVSLSELKQPSIALNRLATALGWEISRMSHQITRMNGAGLVAKTQSETDARCFEVSITDYGRTIIEPAIPLQSREINHCFSDILTDEQKNSLIEISAAISAHMREHHPLNVQPRTAITTQRMN
jgi:DNA-binding MarR family transcriptional regulator